MAMDTCRRCERRTHVNTSRICADCAEGKRELDRGGRACVVLPAWAAEFDFSPDRTGLPASLRAWMLRDDQEVGR